MAARASGEGDSGTGSAMMGADGGGGELRMVTEAARAARPFMVVGGVSTREGIDGFDGAHRGTSEATRIARPEGARIGRRCEIVDVEVAEPPNTTRMKNMAKMVKAGRSW